MTPSLRERVQDRAIQIIGGQRYQQRQERLAGILENAYRRGPALVPTQTLFERLGEVDARLLDLWARQFGYEILEGRWVGQYELTEEDRLRVVTQSRWQYHRSAQYENTITMWTDFGFGQQVEIVPEDEDARIIWDEAFTAKRNRPLFKQRKLHELSDDILRDGELFFAAYANTIDGRVTFRRFRTDDVKEIVYDKEDTDVPVWYKVKVAKNSSDDNGYTYFPDWEASQQNRDQEWERIQAKEPDAKRIEDRSKQVEISGEQITVTDAVMMQAAPAMRRGRGWPKMYRFMEWDDSLKRHIGDHLAVAKSVATYVDKVIAKGGSRAVDAIAARFASTLSTGASDWVERNPAPAAGGVMTTNDAVTVERRPLTTAAGDAQTTSGLVAGQMSAASKTPLHWMGYPQQLQNRATARETNRPFIEQMERYLQFWSDVFADMVAICLMFAEKYDPIYMDGFTTDAVGVTFESPQLIPPDEIASVMKAISDIASVGMLDAGVAERANEWLTGLALVNLGARNVPAIIEPEDGEAVPEPEEPEEEMPEPETEAQAIFRLVSEMKRMDQEQEHARLSGFLQDVSEFLDRQQRRVQVSEAAEAVKRAAAAVENEGERVTEVHAHVDVKPPDVTIGKTVVNMPEQEPPVVEVTTGETHVHVPEQAAPQVDVRAGDTHVHLPEQEPRRSTWGTRLSRCRHPHRRHQRQTSISISRPS